LVEDCPERTEACEIDVCGYFEPVAALDDVELVALWWRDAG
jgi:hypothetical protein